MALTNYTNVRLRRDLTRVQRDLTFCNNTARREKENCEERLEKEDSLRPG